MNSAQKQVVNLPCEVCSDAKPASWRTLRYPQYGYPGAFELCRCGGCGLVFNSPRLVPEALSQLYDHNYYIFAEPAEEAFQRVAGLHHATVARLEAVAPARGPVLEVGSAKGYMLGLLKDRGWDVQGVELSSHAAAYAQSAFGVPVYNGTLESWVQQPGFVPRPLAYSTDVIEHVPSPRDFLRAMHRAIAEDGLLLIGTPNIASDGVEAHGADWLGFNPFHIWLFSRETLSRLLAQNGFDVLEAWTFGNAELGRYPAMSPAKRWLRDTAARSGLLNGLRRLRGGEAPPPSAEALAALRTETGRQLAAAPDWRDSEDGRHPRAAACRGDNLVILARRRPGALA